MARWHMSSRRDWHEDAVAICARAGLRMVDEQDGPICMIRSYSKRAIRNNNFFKLNRQEWIASAGTIVFDGSIGANALELFYQYFREHGLLKARARAIGQFALAIGCNDRVYVCTDDQGSFSLYYYTEGRNLFISNSLHVVAESVGKSARSPLELLLYTFQIDDIGKNTHIDGVCRLFGSEYLEIAEGTCECIPEARTWEHLDQDGSLDFSHTLERYMESVERVFCEISRTDDIAVHMTGGMDSRTVLAALLREGVRPRLMCGVGNSNVATTRELDTRIVKNIAKTIGLSYYEMNWAGTQPHDRDNWKRLFDLYGFLFTTYGSSEQMLEEFEGRIAPYPILQLGGYSAAFTNRKPWEDEKKAFSLDDLVADFLSPDANHLVGNAREDYERLLRERMAEALSRARFAYPERGATLMQFAMARTFLQVRPDSRAANFFNEFGFYISPFASGQLFELLAAVPTEMRSKDAFQLALIHELAPSLDQFEFMTGGRTRVVDQRHRRVVGDRRRFFLTRCLRSCLGTHTKRAAVAFVLRVPLLKRCCSILDPCLFDDLRTYKKDREINGALLKELSTALPFNTMIREGSSLSSLAKLQSTVMMIFASSKLERSAVDKAGKGVGDLSDRTAP